MSANEGIGIYKDIDNELLIQEVKVRPALYNRNLKEYNDQGFKKSMWEEISAQLYDSWDDMSEMQKENKAAELLKRWNNLRTCFSRELKIMRDPLQNKRRKYIYFDKLLFLIDEMRPDLITGKESDSLTTPTFTFSNFSIDQEEESEHHKIVTKTPESKSTGRHKIKNREFENYVKKAINDLREELTSKEKTEDSDSTQPFHVNADTYFAMSLIPMLKMIPLEKKIDAQIDILNVLKRYSSRYEFKVVKFEREDEQSETDENPELFSYYREEK